MIRAMQGPPGNEIEVVLIDDQRTKFSHVSSQEHRPRLSPTIIGSAAEASKRVRRAPDAIEFTQLVNENSVQPPGHHQGLLAWHILIRVYRGSYVFFLFFLCDIWTPASVAVVASSITETPS